MKTADQIYLELFELWVKRVRTKTYTFEAYEFERDAGGKMHAIAEALASLTWAPSGFHRFTIHHPERVIYAPAYPDRIAEAWICEQYIKPYVSPKVIRTNMASQKDKGMLQAMRELRMDLAWCFRKYGYDFYFVQFDMQGYYDNLSHAVIGHQFSGMDPEGYLLTSHTLGSWESDPEVSYAKQADPDGKYGVPKGNLPSQWFGVMYLNELDHLIAKRKGCMGYIRYMDDGIALFRTRQECREVMEMTADYLKENHMGIVLHPRKSGYAPINRGFNFCGWHYEIKPSGKILIRLKQSKKKEQIQKLKYLQGAYRRGEVSIREVNDMMRGIMAYLEWGDAYRLQKYYADRFVFTHGDKPEPVSRGYTEEEIDQLIEDLLLYEDF
jgi:hypothetical protein